MTFLASPARLASFALTIILVELDAAQRTVLKRFFNRCSYLWCQDHNVVSARCKTAGARPAGSLPGAGTVTRRYCAVSGRCAGARARAGLKNAFGTTEGAKTVGPKVVLQHNFRPHRFGPRKHDCSTRVSKVHLSIRSIGCSLRQLSPLVATQPLGAPEGYKSTAGELPCTPTSPRTPSLAPAPAASDAPPFRLCSPVRVVAIGGARPAGRSFKRA